MGTDVNQTDFSVRGLSLALSLHYYTSSSGCISSPVLIFTERSLTLTKTIQAVYLAQSRVPEIIAGSIIPFVLASIIVFFRLYSRGIILRAWGWNDTLILICWLGGLTLIVIQCILTTCGVGRHIVLRPTSKIRLLRELALAAQIIYSLVLGIAKLSICICVLQEFRDVSIRMKYIIYLMFIFVTTYTTVLFFFLIFRCGSISTALSLGFSASKCWMQRDDIMILFAAFNITADFGLLVLVLLQIRRSLCHLKGGSRLTRAQSP